MIMSQSLFRAAIAAAGLLFAFSSAYQISAQSAATQTVSLDKDAPVTLYKNARIYTNDPQAPWASAMLVRGEELLVIGDEDEVSALAEKGTGVVDLSGHFVMPGFNDAHVHLGSAGQDASAVRIHGASTIAEAQNRLSAAVAQTKPGEWVTGSGWDHTLWPEKRFLTRQDLDSVSPNNPVFLVHISGHVAVVNSAALKLARITAKTPNPTGGEGARDLNRETGGVLQEDAHIAPVDSKNP